MSEEKYHWTTEYDGFNDVLDDENAVVPHAAGSDTIVPLWSEAHPEVTDPEEADPEEQDQSVEGSELPETESSEAGSSETESSEAGSSEAEAAENQAPPILELAPEDAEELAARIEARRRQRRRKRIRKKRFTIFCIILAFVFMFTMCGREIFRLKAENYALQKQKQELIEERDRLAEELKKVSDKEYIKNQARKQMRLLDPGEIMFVFEGDEESEPEKTD